ncbi:hypothetical protein LSAT2_000562 [Lamellibrachia satsuma]|nr:hypothetical protein LSAT2_000562 [Lamellibrachia satsuma]
MYFQRSMLPSIGSVCFTAKGPNTKRACAPVMASDARTRSSHRASETCVSPLKDRAPEPCVSPLKDRASKPCVSPLKDRASKPCVSPLKDRASEPCVSPLKDRAIN